MTKSKSSKQRPSANGGRLWGVYIRAFDGYETVWKFLLGPFVSKRVADEVADRERIARVTAELTVKPI